MRIKQYLHAFQNRLWIDGHKADILLAGYGIPVMAGADAVLRQASERFREGLGGK